MSHAEFEYLGPYLVEGVLGRGGMGTVYKGTHARSGDKVAIKVIATGIADQVRFRKRFAAEIKVLKRLKHPHIVSLIGDGEERGLLFYAMEFVAGHSLLDHMRQHRVLPWEDVLHIGIETAAALKHAHDLGIIHRDLKPANLMLTNQGQVKLTDFGIAKLFGSKDETAAGAVIGTADYMPPEQAEGKTVTTRSDTYSLGCVLYALLAGRAPFGGKSIPEVLYAVRYNPVPDLLTLAPTCPPELAALITEMLDKDPQKRPPTALVVGNRMKAIQAGMRKITGGSSKMPSESGSTLAKDKIGKELTSLDLSDADDDDIRLTHPEISSAQDQPTMLAPQPTSNRSNSDQPTSNSFVTNEEVTSVVTGGILPAIVTERSNNARSQSKPSSHASGGVAGPASVDDPVTFTGPSRFTHVSESDASESVFGVAPVSNPAHQEWIQYLSIGFMVAALLGCVALGWWMFRLDSADDLYAQIAAAVDSGDEYAMQEVRPAIDEFIARFPDDTRRGDVQAIADDADLQQALSRLQRIAARKREAMSAIEQAFLDCLIAREKTPETYQAKLQAFLAVFGQLSGLSRPEQRLVELAKFAEKVQPTPKLEIPQSTIQLEKLIRSAEAELSGAALLDYYRSLLVLYEGKPWAAEQLARIRGRLASDAADGK